MIMCSYKGYGFQGVKSRIGSRHQAPVVQKMGKAIHWINIHPFDSAIVCLTAYPLDSDFIRWIALSSV